jgi:hypothetical protein
MIEAEPIRRPQDDPRWGAYYKEQADLARARRCSQISTPSQVAFARPRSVPRFASVFRGVQVDIEHIRRLTPLPETLMSCARSPAG